ncbi:tRNA (adenosine(37)-N6)-threonylcarbamoyltransferase complex dimerization subunit type 1 TsaB [Jatrophihabitans lederbergiae]|uniref:tRNA (Adenosine(37)-N6)-threonylcarbamoyltransferase complex dimerization subunit type 1 TsaB n=1 Tax=Jatrophihabitans lederbergiae TaxID=3075547 RepID=A0ABU2J5E2_9ACTN|nr:tRNA (adenosine(37)-N6)-threonylcarbamoyltransferase complex dimerization subunit type 1 TsaB [Jatrophihabitans sp. DSM 44399]MDT0260208.1 tRNA (adenosine(37)-N6)-threonylcarbamoyltransferase complex dimerization subunit type 1 TsaB [Jatrophihabitans sp. DSM 44399]
MLALVIDTSSAAVTAGVAEVASGVAPRVLAQQVIIDARAHGERLAPSIQASLAEAGVRFPDLAAVVAGTGPGPFTGLRVGLVTAAAIGDATGLPTYGACSLDAIAAVHADCADLLVAGDARRKEVYWARYRHGIRTAGPEVTKPAELSTEAAAMAGAGARLYSDVLGLPLLEEDYPPVAGLAAVAAERVLNRAPGEPLTPLYLRRPDAVAPGERRQVTA